ncbi:MAG: AAA family ATPase [Candidatus Methanospirareceae archaeon]
MVTGSSSKLMGKEISTALTGRHVDIEVFPLDFTEFLVENLVGAYTTGISSLQSFNRLKKRDSTTCRDSGSLITWVN